jgi:hypothetical protein
VAKLAHATRHGTAPLPAQVEPKHAQLSSETSSKAAASAAARSVASGFGCRGDEGFICAKSFERRISQSPNVLHASLRAQPFANACRKKRSYCIVESHDEEGSYSRRMLGSPASVGLQRPGRDVTAVLLFATLLQSTVSES